jgi:alkanesulfonate monooxygenase SsuD/methylene tetrahydromethanopterin reductase-like flavin-dependent oxidoreductase (luciferase family)
MTDEQIGYLREVFASDTPEFQGRFYQISGMSVDPKPVNRGVPIWIGGNTEFAMRRAAALGDGIHFIDLSNKEAENAVAGLRAACAKAGRAFEELSISNYTSLRITADRLEESERGMPITGNIDQVVADVRYLGSLGFSQVAFSPRPRNMDTAAYLKVMETIAREVKPAVN